MSQPNRHALSRRSLLYTASMMAAAGALHPALRAARAEDAPTPVSPVLPGQGQAKQVVVLFMSGGASHLETFDPKPGTSAGGPTRAIPTAVPGVHIASTLPRLAKRMNRIALLRGMSTKEGNHQRARYLMHTGYAPTPTVAHPSFGAWMSYLKGDPEADLPAYVAVNGPGEGSGLVGPGHAPFQVRIAQGGRGQQARAPKKKGQVVQNLSAPRGMSNARRDRRLGLHETLNRGFGARHGAAVPDAQRAMFDRARRLMDSPKNTAFDLSEETQATQERYGKDDFGAGCLMARRLLDQGVKVVEVMSNGWDTHFDNFNRVATLNGAVDRGASALLDDLQASGKLDETLVVWVGDFGRTPRITSTQGRGHYPRAWSTWMAGGGVQGGRVLGATSTDGSTVTDGAVAPADFFASLAHATGMDPQFTLFANGRPISVVHESGRVVQDLFAL